MNQSESIHSFDAITADSPSKLLWFMSELYWPEDRSTGFYVTAIAESAAAKLPVGVICSQPTYDAKGTHRPAAEKRAGVSIYRTWNTKFNKNNLALRLINALTTCLSACLVGLRRVSRGDVIVCVTNPPFLPLVAWIISTLRRCRYVILVHDVYPGILGVAGAVQPGSLLYRSIQKLYNFLYRRAQGIIVIGQDMADRILADCPELAGKIDLIRNWADAEAIAPESIQSNALLRQLDLTDKFIIQFSGNIGRTHGAEILIEAAEHLRDEPDIHFLIIGNGAKRRCLELEVNRRCLGNITFADYQPRESLGSTLSACHVALVTMAPGMLGLSVPSRSYNIMAAGRPMIVVAESDSEIATMVSSLNIGWVVAPGHAEELANAIRAARSAPELLQEMSCKAREAAITAYERGETLRHYTKVLSRFLTS